MSKTHEVRCPNETTMKNQMSMVVAMMLMSIVSIQAVP